MDLTRSAGDQQDDKTVEPGVLETCNTEQALEAVKVVRTRARRIPSSAQSDCSTRGRIHLRGPSVSFTFRLQHGDGPYIPYWQLHTNNRQITDDGAASAIFLTAIV